MTVPCCNADWPSAYGTRPFSIVVTTRGGRKRFVAEWLPTRCRRTFDAKREATAFVKEHERRATR